MLQRPELESEYRRGYRDGWMDAMNAVADLLGPNTLANVELVLQTCWMFGNDQLERWKSGDCQKRLSPPRVPGTYIYTSRDDHSDLAQSRDSINRAPTRARR